MRWPIPLNSDADLVLSSVFFSLLDSFPFFHTQESGIFLLAVTIPFSFHTQGTSSKVLLSASNCIAGALFPTHVHGGT